MEWLTLAVILAVILLIAYWQLIIAEGAYLGSGVVTLLYDITAPRYNRIKNFNPDDDAHFLGRPLTEALASIHQPLVLDVATGTGRLPISLLANEAFDGTIVAVDLSWRMLREAASVLRGQMARSALMQQDASRLAFAGDTFDAVACLEALEFTPDPHGVLAECVRVLKPGGVLMVTRRAGPWARWMPGRTPSPQRFKAQIESLGVWDVQVQIWQVDYDLVWGVKIAQWEPIEDGEMPSDEMPERDE